MFTCNTLANSHKKYDSDINAKVFVKCTCKMVRISLNFVYQYKTLVFTKTVTKAILRIHAKTFRRAFTNIIYSPMHAHAYQVTAMHTCAHTLHLLFACILLKITVD